MCRSFGVLCLTTSGWGTFQQSWQHKGGKRRINEMSALRLLTFSPILMKGADGLFISRRDVQLQMDERESTLLRWQMKDWQMKWTSISAARYGGVTICPERGSQEGAIKDAASPRHEGGRGEVLVVAGRSVPPSQQSRAHVTPAPSLKSN